MSAGWGGGGFSVFRSRDFHQEEFQPVMSGDTFPITAPKDCSKKFAATLRHLD